MRRYRFCTAPLDKAAQVRELEEFFRGQKPHRPRCGRLAHAHGARPDRGGRSRIHEWLAASTAHEAALRHLGQSLAAARSIPPEQVARLRAGSTPALAVGASRTPGTGPAAPVLRRAPRLELVPPAAAPCPGGPVLHGGPGLGRGRGLAPVAAAAHLHQQPPDPTRPGQDHHLAGWHRTVPGCRYPGASNSVPRPARSCASRKGRSCLPWRPTATGPFMCWPARRARHRGRHAVFRALSRHGHGGGQRPGGRAGRPCARGRCARHCSR